MEGFTIKALQYGVLGLCAVMLIAAWRIITKEQNRDGPLRPGIIIFTSVFLGFCLLLAGLNAYVQIREHSDKLRETSDQLAATSNTLSEARGEIVILNQKLVAIKQDLDKSLQVQFMATKFALPTAQTKPDALPITDPTNATSDHSLSLASLQSFLPATQWAEFSDDVNVKALVDLPCNQVEKLITVFFEPKGTSTNFLKIQQLEFGPNAHGHIALRGRVAGHVPSDENVPKLFIYHFGLKGVEREKSRSYVDTLNQYEFDIEPNDTITFIAKYKGPLVAGDYGRKWRDWHTVEVSDLAPKTGLWYGFYTGSANYDVHIADSWDFFPSVDRQIKLVRGNQTFSGRLGEAQSFLTQHLATVLRTAEPDIESDKSYRGALRFLLDSQFSGVRWAVHESPNQTRDAVYITERD